MLGNNTRIGCLRLEAHIAAFYGTEREKRKLLKELKKAQKTMSECMNEPLNEAEINESIGLIASNIVIICKTPKFPDAEEPYL
jgi:ABC-type uncharacterized transport system fused permease/ATPase subunit